MGLVQRDRYPFIVYTDDPDGQYIPSVNGVMANMTPYRMLFVFGAINHEVQDVSLLDSLFTIDGEPVTGFEEVRIAELAGYSYAKYVEVLPFQTVEYDQSVILAAINLFEACGIAGAEKSDSFLVAPERFAQSIETAQDRTLDEGHTPYFLVTTVY